MAGLLVVTGLAAGPAAAGGRGYQPDFEVGSCDEEQFAGRLPAGVDAECGLLTVPEDRERPMTEGNTVVLPVVVLKAIAGDPQPDPVLLLAGGPGGSGIDGSLLSGAGLPGWAQALNEQRDVIVLDTRGTGKAQPSLLCLDDELGVTAWLAAIYEIFATTDDPVTERAVLDQAYVDCAADLREQGVDLDQYDTPTIAEDLGDLRKALGINKWNVYGVSAGATGTLELLRQQPGGQRSVVLDSPYAPFIEIDPASLTAYSKAAFHAVIEAVGLDQGEVEASLAAIQDRYNSIPYSATDPYLGVEVNFTGGDAIMILAWMMGGADLVPLLELFLANLQYYDGTDATAGLSLEPYFGAGVETVFDLFLGYFYPVMSAIGWSTGHFIAVECADRSQLLDPADYGTVLAAEPVYGNAWFPLPTMPNVCEQVDVEPVPTRTYKVHQVGVPSLVLAGSLDPQRTPPAVTAQVSEMLGPWSQFVEFPRATHGIAGYSDLDPVSQCADQMIADFIDAPREAVDTSCTGG